MDSSKYGKDSGRMRKISRIADESLAKGDYMKCVESLESYGEMILKNDPFLTSVIRKVASGKASFFSLYDALENKLDDDHILSDWMRIYALLTGERYEWMNGATLEYVNRNVEREALCTTPEAISVISNGLDTMAVVEMEMIPFIDFDRSGNFRISLEYEQKILPEPMESPAQFENKVGSMKKPNGYWDFNGSGRPSRTVVTIPNPRLIGLENLADFVSQLYMMDFQDEWNDILNDKARDIVKNSDESDFKQSGKIKKMWTRSVIELP